MTTLLRRIRRLFPMPIIDGYDDPRIAARVTHKTLNHDTANHFPIGPHDLVLDFGGGAGVAYYGSSAGSRWAIVETLAMVAANADAEDPCLQWFTNIPDAIVWLGSRPDYILADGSVQYTPDPYATVLALAALSASRIHYRRLPLWERPTRPYIQHSFLSDHGPGEPCGREAHVRTIVRPLRRCAFLNAHWQYEPEELSEGEWMFTRRAV